MYLGLRCRGRSRPSVREAQAAEQFETSAPLQASHMHVTDRATEQVVRTLSRYELAGLRRRASYGDDSAAFQMGMAYEIGRALPQSCTTAAQWVATAASEGNVAAQYNLGLRYSDGDGVPVNEVEAVKCCRRQQLSKVPQPRSQWACLPHLRCVSSPLRKHRINAANR